MFSNNNLVVVDCCDAIFTNNGSCFELNMYHVVLHECSLSIQIASPWLKFECQLKQRDMLLSFYTYAGFQTQTPGRTGHSPLSSSYTANEIYNERRTTRTMPCIDG